MNSRALFPASYTSLEHPTIPVVAVGSRVSQADVDMDFADDISESNLFTQESTHQSEEGS